MAPAHNTQDILILVFLLFGAFVLGGIVWTLTRSTKPPGNLPNTGKAYTPPPKPPAPPSPPKSKPSTEGGVNKQNPL